jgi:hypothetical protein
MCKSRRHTPLVAIPCLCRLLNSTDYVALVTSCRDTLVNYNMPDSTINSFVFGDLAASGLVASPLSSVAAAQNDTAVRFNLTAFGAKLQK